MIASSNPRYFDTDNDGMSDGYELAHACLNVLATDHLADPDGDGLATSAEKAKTTNPCDADTDHDGFEDRPMSAMAGPPRHAPVNADSRFDSCPTVANPDQLNSDGNFIDLGPGVSFDDVTRPYSDDVGNACDDDDDNDSILDAREVTAWCSYAPAGTDPLDADTDDDGALDVECAFGGGPLDPNSTPVIPPNSPDSNDDRDRDGLTLWFERVYLGTSDYIYDTDGDGCPDGREIASINSDTRVNVIDLQVIASHISVFGDPRYIVGLDVTRDRAINVLDLSFVAQRQGACP